MSLEEKDTIERIMTKGNKTIFVLIEHRKWNQIKDPQLKLWNKIEKAEAYAKSKEAIKKFGNNIEIVFTCKYNPPENISKILKSKGVKIKIIK